MTTDEKPCPACGEAIKAVAAKCRFCGEDIEAFVAKRAAGVEKTLFAGRPAAIYTVGQVFWIAITLGLAAIVYWLRAASTRYEFTTQRIRIESGLLSKVRNSVELIRIDDFQVEQPLGMRLLGFGILRLVSTDRTVPRIAIVGLKDVERLAEEIRSYSLRERERRGVRVFASA